MPNCVNSQSGTLWNAVEPLKIVGDPQLAWKKAVSAVKEAGGEVEIDDGEYLHAVFTSGFFRFKDDLELLLDGDAGVIHVRSEARLGNFDFGVNRKRVEKIRALYDNEAELLR